MWWCWPSRSAVLTLTLMPPSLAPQVRRRRSPSTTALLFLYSKCCWWIVAKTLTIWRPLPQFKKTAGTGDCDTSEPTRRTPDTTNMRSDTRLDYDNKYWTFLLFACRGWQSVSSWLVWLGVWQPSQYPCCPTDDRHYYRGTRETAPAITCWH